MAGRILSVTIGAVSDVPTSALAVDGLDATDAVTTAMAGVRPVAEAVGAADTVSTILNAVTAVADPAGLSDAATASLSSEEAFGALVGRAMTVQSHTFSDLPAQTAAGTSRYQYAAQQDVASIRLVYGNWFNTSYKSASPSYCQDVANTATITVQALVFPPGSAVGIPVTVGGATSWTIAGGAWVQTDPIGITLAAGATFDVQTYVTGTQWYPTLINGGGFASGNQAGAGSAKVGSNGNVLFTPMLITGNHASPMVLLCGDSIVYDSARGDRRGYVEQGLTGYYGTISSASPGDRLYWYLAGRRSIGMSRAFDACATAAVVEYGRNDLGDNRTTAQLQADLISLWNARAASGQRVIQTTITPQTTSTDAWATTANQTIASSTQEGRRRALNDWIRGGAPIVAGAAVAVGTSGANVAGDGAHPLVGYWEIADQVETARNSGIWRAGYTTDGLHPGATGIAAAAAGVDRSLIPPPPALYPGNFLYPGNSLYPTGS